MSFRDAILRANGEAWSGALNWLWLNIILIIFPLIFAYMLILGDSGSFNFQDPISHGELTLVSLSLLGDGIYAISKGLKIASEDQTPATKNTRQIDRFRHWTANFPGGAWLSTFSLTLLLLSLTFFATSFNLNTKLSNYQQILNFRIVATVFLLIASIATTFFITLIDASIVNNPPDPQEMSSNNTKAFQAKMNKRTWRKS